MTMRPPRTAREEDWNAFVLKAADMIRRRNGDANAATFVCSVTDHNEQGFTAELFSFGSSPAHRLTLIAHLIDMLAKEAPPDLAADARQLRSFFDQTFRASGESGVAQ